jgi:uncharacterized protein (DUF2062 family)
VNDPNQMSRWLEIARKHIGIWLGMGLTPRRLALTLALGFAIGCLPVLGVTTALCLLVAVVLRLNMPAIQAANYAAMPLQLILIVPFVRLGGWLFASREKVPLSSILHGSPLERLHASGRLAGEAVGAWILFAGPLVLVMTLVLTPILRRVPALADQCAE